jgi:hypothetical protein
VSKLASPTGAGVTVGETGEGVEGRVVGEIDAVGVGKAVGGRVGEGDSAGGGDAVSGLEVGEAVAVDVDMLDVAAGIGVDCCTIGVDPGVLEPPQPVMSKSTPARNL